MTTAKVAWVDLAGVLGVPAGGDRVYLSAGDGLVSFDLRTGQRTEVSASEAEKVLAAAPTQAWVSSGMVRNDALLHMTDAARATLEHLRYVEAGTVISVDDGARRVLTAAASAVCVWDLRELVRQSCAPNLHASYELIGGKVFVSTMADGQERFAVLDELDMPPVWQVEMPEALRQRPRQWPCDLNLVPSAGGTVFERAGNKLFSLFDFGADGWALVLPDGSHKASAPALAGLAFIGPDGEPFSEARVRALYAPHHVQRQVGSVRPPAGCVF